MAELIHSKAVVTVTNTSTKWTIHRSIFQAFIRRKVHELLA